jgi:hypothetical protein
MTMTSELSAAPDQPVAEPRKSRKNNPEKTRENILQEAIVEFVQQGFPGRASMPSPSASTPLNA